MTLTSLLVFFGRTSLLDGTYRSVDLTSKKTILYGITQRPT
nr:MAG TPA: hypothetical protein [Inoviridae sp.]